MSNFNRLEVVGRGGQTQLQVYETVNSITCREWVLKMCPNVCPNCSDRCPRGSLRMALHHMSLI